MVVQAYQGENLECGEPGDSRWRLNMATFHVINIKSFSKNIISYNVLSCQGRHLNLLSLLCDMYRMFCKYFAKQICHWKLALPALGLIIAIKGWKKLWFSAMRHVGCYRVCANVSKLMVLESWFPTVVCFVYIYMHQFWCHNLTCCTPRRWWTRRSFQAQAAGNWSFSKGGSHGSCFRSSWIKFIMFFLVG